MTTTTALNAKCVATTGDTFCKTIADFHVGEPNARYNRSDSNHFREAQFSGDGTTIVTYSEDQCLRTFVLPIDLLDDTKHPHGLASHCISESPSSIQSYALYPTFDLQNPSTTLTLSAAKDLPIRLSNVLHYDTLHSAYPLINPTTEEYVSPNSLVWTRDGSHFIAGSMNQISVFDSSYDGSGPVLQHKTAPGKAEKRRYGKSSPQSCSGIFSALSISPDGMVAGGTSQREVTLYANEGSGECVSSFSVAARAGRRDPTTGNGVVHLAWSPSGTYLFIAERQSDGIQVYDVRKTLNRVAWLSGRNARTMQRLGTDVVPTADGCEIWAGGNDGCVRIWKNPGEHSGEQAPDGILDLHDGE